MAKVIEGHKAIDGPAPGNVVNYFEEFVRPMLNTETPHIHEWFLGTISGAPAIAWRSIWDGEGYGSFIKMGGWEQITAGAEMCVENATKTLCFLHTRPDSEQIVKWTEATGAVEAA